MVDGWKIVKPVVGTAATAVRNSEVCVPAANR